MSKGGIILDNGDNVALKVGIVMCKLVCKGWKDVFEFLSVKIISGAEEASTKEPLFGNCL